VTLKATCQIFILDNAERFPKKRKLYKKCGPAKVKDKDLPPWHHQGKLKRNLPEAEGVTKYAR